MALGVVLEVVQAGERRYALKPGPSGCHPGLTPLLEAGRPGTGQECPDQSCFRIELLCCVNPVCFDGCVEAALLCQSGSTIVKASSLYVQPVSNLDFLSLHDLLHQVFVCATVDVAQV